MLGDTHPGPTFFFNKISLHQEPLLLFSKTHADTEKSQPSIGSHSDLERVSFSSVSDVFENATMLPNHAEFQSSRMKGQQEVPTLRFLQLQMARQLSPLLNARRIHDEHF